MRPTIDQYMIEIAKVVSTRSTCDRLQAGAVITAKDRIVSTGYNGSPPGQPHCDNTWHEMENDHCVRTIHSEHNAILQASRIGGISLIGTTMYSLYSPCYQCCRYILSAGISRVVYQQEYRDTKGLEYLKQAGVIVEKL